VNVTFDAWASNDWALRMEDASVSDAKETDKGSRQKSCEHTVTIPISKLEEGLPFD
jgi:hypothetical protein